MAAIADLDDLLQNYFFLEKLIKELCTANKELKDELTVSDKRLYFYASTEKTTNADMKKLMETVQDYQIMLSDYDKTKEENRQLTSNLQECKDQIKKIEQEHEENRKESLQHIHELQEGQKNEIIRIQNQANEFVCNEISIYETKLKSLAKEIEVLKSRLTQKERDYQFQLDKTKLECDSKLQYMQQKQISQAKNSSVTARNDILRKKLQHQQVELENELKTLRAQCTYQVQQITDLQHQLKLQNKKYQEQSKQHQDLLKRQERAIRQSQAESRQSQGEVRRLQSQLKQAHESVTTLQRNVDEHKERQVEQTVAPRRKKSMFNPNNNRLGPLT